MYIIDKNAENEIIIKKSRFITKLYYIEDVNKVNDIINELKKEYKKCTHICYSYIIGQNAKAVDDGEPSGTAGKPILNVLQKKDMTNVLCVVIRYFGGIKLGAGGLVRAYSKSVMEAVGEAEIVEIEEYDVYQITFEYSNIKTADAEVRNNQLTTINKYYTDKVSYEIVSKENRDIERIFEKYSGKISVKYKNKQFLEKI